MTWHQLGWTQTFYKLFPNVALFTNALKFRTVSALSGYHHLHLSLTRFSTVWCSSYELIDANCIPVSEQNLFASYQVTFNATSTNKLLSISCVYREHKIYLIEYQLVLFSADPVHIVCPKISTSIHISHLQQFYLYVCWMITTCSIIISSNQYECKF